MKNNLPLILNIKTLDHLSLRIGISYDELKHIIKDKPRNVSAFEKKKPNSTKVRKLFNPYPRYKFILRKINKSLLIGDLAPGVLGGVVGKQVEHVAKAHCGKEAIFSIDLKDFFPSIHGGQVISLFKRAGCSPEVCGLLADLITFDGCLPQGFPTSTAVANWVAYDLDMQHLGHCEKHDITRTRWVDDMTFSGRYSTLKDSIPSLIGAIKHHGLKVNNRKTTFVPRQHCSKVLGFDVSGEKPRVPASTIKRIEDIILDCKACGVEVVRIAYDYGDKNIKLSLDGHVRYIERYNPKDGVKLRGLLNEVDWNCLT